MAQSKFSILSTRNQSSLVSQLHKLINYYGSIFPTRERTYLKKLSQQDGSIYWIEDDSKKLVAASIVDANYKIDLKGLELIPFGHTISKQLGTMERILKHVFNDYANQNLILFLKPLIAGSMELFKYDLIELNVSDLIEKTPKLANAKTDYFNVTGETLHSALARKENRVYLKLSPEGKEFFRTNFTKLDL